MAVSKKTVSIRELRAQAPAIVDRAEHGETTIVTRHGKPVACVTPLEPIMNTYTYAIEVSDDGEIWMPEGDAAVATMASSDSAEDFARDVLDTWVDDLPAGQRGGHRRIVVWNGDQQDTVDMAICVITGPAVTPTTTGEEMAITEDRWDRLAQTLQDAGVPAELNRTLGVNGRSCNIQLPHNGCLVVVRDCWWHDRWTGWQVSLEGPDSFIKQEYPRTKKRGEVCTAVLDAMSLSALKSGA